MACACKVNKDISYIQKRYGNKKQRENAKASESLGRGITDLIINMATIMLIPFMAISVMIVSLFGKKKVINISKFPGMKRKRNVRREQ